MSTSRKPKYVWFESYRCGCVSEYEVRKKDLSGYCPKHGDSRRETWKVPNEEKVATNA